jgi:hypothetical protein
MCEARIPCCSWYGLDHLHHCTTPTSFELAMCRVSPPLTGQMVVDVKQNKLQSTAVSFRKLIVPCPNTTLLVMGRQPFGLPKVEAAYIHSSSAPIFTVPLVLSLDDWKLRHSRLRVVDAHHSEQAKKIVVLCSATHFGTDLRAAPDTLTLIPVHDQFCNPTTITPVQRVHGGSQLPQSTVQSGTGMSTRIFRMLCPAFVGLSGC